MTLRWVKLYLELDGPASLDPENRRPLISIGPMRKTISTRTA
jgi:hypothetical protein